MCVEVYMDDFSVYGNEFDESLQNLEKALIRCIESNLSLSNEKWFILLTEGIVLGNHISPEGIKVDLAKVEIILKLSSPKNQKDVRSFLGYAGYHWSFIENFSRIALPLFKLFVKDVEFFLNSNCQIAFKILKEKISTTLVLRGPDWKLPFHISTDALDTAVGGVLGQKEETRTYVIYFISKNMTPAELNYTTTEKKMLVVIDFVNKFWHYIMGYEVFVHMDHSSIRYLMNKPITHGRVTRWLLLL